jgi:1,2-diacylglycerol 3-alpha-glucosyltransferase
MSTVLPVASGAEQRLLATLESQLDSAAGRRVLIGTDTYPPDVNGAGYFTHRLATGLAARGNDVHVVCPSEQGPAEVQLRDGVTVHRLRSLPLVLHPRMRFVLPGVLATTIDGIIADVAPDVVHVQGHFPVGRACLNAARRASIPVLATNHFMPDNLMHHLRIPRRLRARIAARAWRDAARVFARADHVTTPTPLAAETFTANGFAADIEPVSCGIDLTRFQPREGDPAALRRRFGLPDRHTVLFVGRLDEEKHIDELIRALPALRRRVDAQLVVAGTGPQHDALTALAADLKVSPYVKLLGFVPDAELAALYQAATMFAIAGTAELQSIVTLEAMASGLPVVAANAVALPHLVRNGRNGYLFTPGDIDGLTARLEAILCSADETRAMGATSRAMAAWHDENRSLLRFEQIYAQLCAAAARRS